MIDGLTGSSIAFNGEIYNWKELRDSLSRDGAQFYTESDTEVILQGYLMHGRCFFNKLRGMYAFIIHDTISDSIIALRDPLGIKPMYRGLSEDGVQILCSTQRPIATAGHIQAPDPAAAVSLLVLGSVIEPLSRWRAISALSPGTVYIWSLADGPDFEESLPAPPREIAKHSDKLGPLSRLHTCLSESVEAHLVSDVPIAIFFSSGTDSTLLALLAKEMGYNPILLTIGFEPFRGTIHDEVPVAAQNALRLCLRHEYRYFNAEEIEAAREQLLDVMDTPSADGLNTFLVARLAQDLGIKVALSGVGADELFGGYPSFWQIPLVARLIPASPVTRLLFDALAAAPGARKLFRSPKMRYLHGYLGKVRDIYLLRRAYFLPEECRQILINDPGREAEQRFQLAFAKAADFGHRAGSEAVRYMEQNVYLRSVLLKDADWAAMAYGVEVRTPFVDQRLYTAILGAPNRFTYRKRHLAHLLKILGPSLLRKSAKMGFTVPYRRATPVQAAGAERRVRLGRRLGGAAPREWCLTVARIAFPTLLRPRAEFT